MPFLANHREAIEYLKGSSPSGLDACMCMTKDAQYYRTECFSMVKHVQTGLNCTCEKKIPVILLDNIVKYFRSDLKNEALARIYYKEGEYRMDIPEIIQVGKVSISTVAPEADKGLLVCELHSHNTMRAFWSDVDDEDEIYPMFYGVIGRLDTETPEMRFRAVLNGAKVQLEKEQIFNCRTIKDDVVMQYITAVTMVAYSIAKRKSFFSAEDLAKQLRTLREQLGFNSPIRGDINNAGFRFDAQTGEVFIKDQQTAEKLLSKWRERFVQHPTKETAAKFEAAVLITAIRKAGIT